MIDPAILLGLKNSREKLIVLYLATAYRPMRVHEISKAIGVHRNRCSESLKNLVELGTISQFDEFDTTFYSLEVPSAQRPSSVQAPPSVHRGCARATSKHRRVCIEAAPAQRPSTAGGASISPVSPRKSRTKTSRNKLNKDSTIESHVKTHESNEIKEIKGKFSKNQKTQANAVTPDRGITPPALPSADPLPPEAPQTPPKIDAMAFALQTRHRKFAGHTPRPIRNPLYRHSDSTGNDREGETTGTPAGIRAATGRLPERG